MEYQPPKVYFPGITFNQAFYQSDSYVSASEAANLYLLKVGVAVSKATSTLFQGAVSVLGDFTASLATITQLTVTQSANISNLRVSILANLKDLTVTGLSGLNDVIVLGLITVNDILANGTTNTNELIVNNLSTLKDLTVTGITNLQGVLNVSGLATFQNVLINGIVTFGSINVTEIIFNSFISIKVAASNLIFTNNNTTANTRFSFNFPNKNDAVQILSRNSTGTETGILSTYHWYGNYANYQAWDGSIMNFVIQSVPNAAYRFLLGGNTILVFNQNLFSYGATILCNKLTINPTQQQYIIQTNDVFQFYNGWNVPSQFEFIGYNSQKLLELTQTVTRFLKDIFAPSINCNNASLNILASNNVTCNSVNVSDVYISRKITINHSQTVLNVNSSSPVYYLVIQNGNKNGYIPVYE